MKYLLILSFIGFYSCSVVNTETLVQNPGKELDIPFLVDGFLLDEGEYCNITKPIIYQDKLILMVTNYASNEAWIKCFDKNTLELLWTWSEAMDEIGIPAKGFGPRSYISKGILAIAQSNLSYGIDINSGETIWKNREDNSALSALSGINESISNVHINDQFTHQYIKIANILNGEWENIYDFKKIDSLDINLRPPLAFSWNNIDYLTFISTKWTSSSSTRIHKLNLYNISEAKLEWISDTIRLDHPTSGTPGVNPVFDDGQILLANNAIYSYNIEDGSLEWCKKYENTFSFSTHLSAKNKTVYANNENQFMIGLDVHTGDSKFQTTTGGSASNIVIHDNKCYIASVTVGGLNKLMVLDANSGQILHNENTPFRHEDPQWTFDRVLSVDPETGLVYVADHRYLLVYDFNE